MIIICTENYSQWSRFPVVIGKCNSVTGTHFSLVNHSKSMGFSGSRML